MTLSDVEVWLVVWTRSRLSAKTEARTRKGVPLSPLLLRYSNDGGDEVFKCSHLKGNIRFACLKAELEPKTRAPSSSAALCTKLTKGNEKKVHGLRGNTPFPNPLN